MARAMARTRYRAPKIKYRTKYVKVARRGVSMAAREAREEKHTLYALGAAAALGYAERQEYDLPHVEAVGVAGTYGVLAWIIGKYTKNRSARHMATGLLSIAVNRFAAGDEGTSGDMVEGEIPALEQAYGSRGSVSGMDDDDDDDDDDLDDDDDDSDE